MLDSTVCGSSSGIPRRPRPSLRAPGRTDAGGAGGRGVARDGDRRCAWWWRRRPTAAGWGGGGAARAGGPPAPWPGLGVVGISNAVLSCPGVVLSTVGQDGLPRTAPNRLVQRSERPFRAASAVICARSSARFAGSVVEIHNRAGRGRYRSGRAGGVAASPPSRSSLGPAAPNAAEPRRRRAGPQHPAAAARLAAHARRGIIHLAPRWPMSSHPGEGRTAMTTTHILETAGRTSPTTSTARSPPSTGVRRCS